jgi:hypothetical protein
MQLNISVGIEITGPKTAVEAWRVRIHGQIEGKDQPAEEKAILSEWHNGPPDVESMRKATDGAALYLAGMAADWGRETLKRF